MAENPIKVSIEADTAPLRGALRELEQLSQSFGAQLTGALKSAAVGGRDLAAPLVDVHGSASKPIGPADSSAISKVTTPSWLPP